MQILYTKSLRCFKLQARGSVLSSDFAETHLKSKIRNLLSCSFRWPRGINLSDEVKALIQSLLKRNPQERPSAKQLLSHPWVRGSSPVSAKTLLVAGKKLLEGNTAEAASPGKEKSTQPLQSRGDSPLVQQLIADARIIPDVMPWPESPGRLSIHKTHLALCTKYVDTGRTSSLLRKITANDNVVLILSP